MAIKSNQNPHSRQCRQGACCAGVVPMRAEDWSLGRSGWKVGNEVKTAVGTVKLVFSWDFASTDCDFSWDLMGFSSSSWCK
jgi:hypothetical protein